MSLETVQTIKRTYPAAAEAVARVLIDTDLQKEAVVDLTRKILTCLGFEL